MPHAASSAAALPYFSASRSRAASFAGCVAGERSTARPISRSSLPQLSSLSTNHPTHHGSSPESVDASAALAQTFEANSGAKGSRSLPHQPEEPSIAGPRVLNLAV